MGAISNLLYGNKLKAILVFMPLPFLLLGITIGRVTEIPIVYLFAFVMGVYAIGTMLATMLIYYISMRSVSRSM